MEINQQVLEEVLRARSMTFDTLAERLETDKEVLLARLQSRRNATLLERVADELVVPSFVLYMDHTPDLPSPLLDFRSPTPRSGSMQRQTIAAIDAARRVQEVALELGYAAALPSASIIDSPVATAQTTRQQLGISKEDQLGAKTAAAFYSICRKAIEGLGVFVIHESYPTEDGSGFCLHSDRAPVVVVNTLKQTPGRRLFTLLHELAHVLIAESGISDPFLGKNKIEKWCNEFAGSFLAPSSILAEIYGAPTPSSIPDVGTVRRIASRLNMSQEAVVVRLAQLHLVHPSSHSVWLATVKRLGGNPDWATKSGGGGNVPQEKVKLARYGYSFGRLFGDALRGGRLTPLEIYRISGLKPKYQRSYFEYAVSAGAVDDE